MSITNHNKSGNLTIITGPMYAGKTTLLQNMIGKDLKANIPFLVFKPKIDVRYSPHHLVSHSGKQIRAIPLELDETQKLEGLEYKNIYFDEFQFFGLALAEKILELKHLGHNITISGLQKDYLNEDFGYISWLLPSADSVFILEGTCDLCNMPSTHTFRKIQSKNLILLGEKNEYLGLCGDCYKNERNNETY